MKKIILTGSVATGMGHGVFFTSVDWVVDQFKSKLGIDPYPGTLNLVVESLNEKVKWENVKKFAGVSIISPSEKWCNARCYPVIINERLRGAAVVPEVPGYPEYSVEIIASIFLREALSLSDGSPVSLLFPGPAENDGMNGGA